MFPSDASPRSPAEVSSLNVKLPDFWSSDSELWFILIEATFRKHRITSQSSKFDHVVSSLPSIAAALVRNSIRSPADEAADVKLREELIRRTTESEQRRLQKLLTSEGLGDRKPSEHLRCMFHLLGDKVNTIDAAILRELFLQRLPTQVQMIPSASTSEPPNTIARMADQIVDVSAPGILQIRHDPRCVRPGPTAPTEDERVLWLLDSNRALAANVDQLSKYLAEIRIDRHRSPTRRGQVFYGRRSRSQSPKAAAVC